MFSFRYSVSKTIWMWLAYQFATCLTYSFFINVLECVSFFLGNCIILDFCGSICHLYYIWKDWNKFIFEGQSIYIIFALLFLGLFMLVSVCVYPWMLTRFGSSYFFSYSIKFLSYHWGFFKKKNLNIKKKLSCVKEEKKFTEITSSFNLPSKIPIS